MILKHTRLVIQNCLVQFYVYIKSASDSSHSPIETDTQSNIAAAEENMVGVYRFQKHADFTVCVLVLVHSRKTIFLLQEKMMYDMVKEHGYPGARRGHR